jgi:hypothetical protein
MRDPAIGERTITASSRDPPGIVEVIGPMPSTHPQARAIDLRRIACAKVLGLQMRPYCSGSLWIARMKRLKRTFLGTILLLLALTFCGLIQSSLR